jgi:hypothetical protein
MNAHFKSRKRANLKYLLPIFSLGLILTVSAQQAQQNGANYDPASANMAPVPEDTSQAARQPYPDQTQPSQQQQTQPPPSSNVQNESIQAAQQAREAGQQPNQQPDQQQPMDQAEQPPADNAPLTPEESAAMDELNGDQNPEQTAEQPPPALPDYTQPPAPAPDYMWTPGYWAYAPVGYYWVPGVWVAAPWPGALWTPGYWYFYRGRYCFHHGYWGRYVGFYGGVNYGFGYPGYGFWGGFWNGPHFWYNRSVTHVDPGRVYNVYTRTVMVNRDYVNNTRIAYTGGPHGLRVQPRPAEIAARTQPRLAPMQSQIALRQQAEQNRAQFYNANRGRPAIIANAQPVPADRGVQRPIARPMPAGQIQQVHPGQYQIQSGQYQQRSGQPAPIVRPNQPGYGGQHYGQQQQPNINQPPAQVPGQIHSASPNIRAASPDGSIQPAQPYTRHGQPQQPNTDPGQPYTWRGQPQQPNTSQPQYQVHPQYRPENQSHPAEPYRPPQPIQPQAAPQARPVPEYRPAPQPQAAPRPAQPYYQPRSVPEYRPAPQPQYRPAPMPESRPAPQPQYRPAPMPQQGPQPQQRQQQSQPHGGGRGR